MLNVQQYGVSGDVLLLSKYIAEEIDQLEKFRVRQRENGTLITLCRYLCEICFTFTVLLIRLN